MTYSEMIGNGLLLVAFVVFLLLAQALVTGTIQSGKPPRGVRVWLAAQQPFAFWFVWMIYLAFGAGAGYVGLRLLILGPEGWAGP